MGGTPLALERSYGCLNFDFWDYGDEQDGRRRVGELPILFFYSDSFSWQAVSPISSIS